MLKTRTNFDNIAISSCLGKKETEKEPEQKRVPEKKPEKVEKPKKNKEVTIW